jgi:hypothetical protein
MIKMQSYKIISSGKHIEACTLSSIMLNNKIFASKTVSFTKT